MIPKLVQTLSYWPIYLSLKLFWNYQVEGQENLKGLENKAIIFASNHASCFDGSIGGVSMPRHKNFYPSDFFPIRFLVWRKYYNWNNPFPFPLNLLASAYIRINGSLPVERTGGDLLKALTTVIESLKQKNKIWIFPEGEVTKDGNLQAGRRGVAFLHQQTKAPIVPIALNGTFKMFSLKNLLKRRQIKIKIGQPIFSLENLSLEQGVEKIMSEIAELLTG